MLEHGGRAHVAAAARARPTALRLGWGERLLLERGWGGRAWQRLARLGARARASAHVLLRPLRRRVQEVVNPLGTCREGSLCCRALKRPALLALDTSILAGAASADERMHAICFARVPLLRKSRNWLLLFCPPVVPSQTRGRILIL